MPVVRRYEDYGSSTRCLRWILLIGNLIFCMLGCAIIGVGIWLLVEKIYFVPWVFGTNLAAVSCYMIIVAGSIMFLISFIGCFATLYQIKRLLLIFCFVLVVILLISIMAATIAVVFRVWVSGLIKVYMRESLLSTYGTNMQSDWNNLVTRCWDEVQEKYSCCAIDDHSWPLYRQTMWYKDLPGLQTVDKPYVPFSCCVRNSNGHYYDLHACQLNIKGPPGKQYGPPNPAVHYKGCYNAGRTVLYQIAGYFIGIGFGMVGLMVGGIVCAMLLYKAL